MADELREALDRLKRSAKAAFTHFHAEADLRDLATIESALADKDAEIERLTARDALSAEVVAFRESAERMIETGERLESEALADRERIATIESDLIAEADYWKRVAERLAGGGLFHFCDQCGNSYECGESDTMRDECYARYVARNITTAQEAVKEVAE